MFTLGIIVIILYVLVAMVNVWANANERLAVMKRTKPLLMPLLIIAYFLFRREGVDFHWLFPVALAAGWIGDLTVERAEIGVPFFLLEHVILIVLFIRLMPSTPSITYIILTVSALVLVAGFFLWSIRRKAGKYFPLIALYGLVIVAMAALAFLLITQAINPSHYAIALGSALFLVSDLVLSKDIINIWYKFEPAMAPAAYREPNYNNALVMATYTAAQLLITLGVAYIL